MEGRLRLPLLQDYKDLVGSILDDRPAELAADDLRLVVWSDTIDADSLNWLVRPGEPADVLPGAE